MSQLIKVKEFKPYDLPAGMYYGVQYMVRVSPKNAKAFAGMYPLPRMGYEITVAIAPASHGFKSYLMLKNISGDYYLASHTDSVDRWPEVFKVEVKRITLEQSA